MRRSNCVLAAACSLLVGSWAAVCAAQTAEGSGGELPRLTVMPLQAVAVPSDTAAGLDPVLLAELDALGSHRVVGLTELNAILAAEKTKDLVGCNDVICASEIASALGARRLVSGTVHRTGEVLYLSLVLLDTREQKALSRAQERLGSPEDWRGSVRRAVRQLLGVSPKSGGGLVDPVDAATRWRWRLQYLARGAVDCSGRADCIAKLRERVDEIARVLANNIWTPAFEKERQALEARLAELRPRLETLETRPPPARRPSPLPAAPAAAAGTRDEAGTRAELGRLRADYAQRTWTWFNRDEKARLERQIAELSARLELFTELRGLTRQLRQTRWDAGNAAQKAALEQRIGQITARLGSR